MIFFAGLLMLLLSVVYMLLVVLSRHKQNALITRQKLMREEFEKQLLQSQVETQEETFQVLSRELHDNVGQLLNSAKLFIGIAKRKPFAPIDTLNMATESISSAIQEIRSLSKALDKEWLQQFQFSENLETEINRLNISGELAVRLETSGTILLPSDEQIILFRIVQEALQNTIKHAGATHIDVSVHQANGMLAVTIADNGEGFETGGTGQLGLGLANMSHRAGLLGGSVGWQSDQEKGTTVLIQIPIKPEHI